MFNISHIDHVVLRVKSLDAMRDFYEGVLGCHMERERADLGLYQMRAGNCMIDLVPVDQPMGRAGGAAARSDGRNLHHFCLRMDPFDPKEILNFLKARNIEASPVEQRYGAEGMGPSIYISDPEKNVIELKGPANAST